MKVRIFFSRFSWKVWIAESISSSVALNFDSTWIFSVASLYLKLKFFFVFMRISSLKISDLESSLNWKEDRKLCFFFMRLLDSSKSFSSRTLLSFLVMVVGSHC